MVSFENQSPDLKPHQRLRNIYEIVFVLELTDLRHKKAKGEENIVLVEGEIHLTFYK